MSTKASTFQAERDAIVLLGLLSHMYMNWDPPLKTLTTSLTTQYHGYNIHALIIDNVDGEVLALERNLVHKSECPVNHGEQLAVRAAIERLRVKRPRSSSEAVEEYYRTSLFYDQGARPEDFLNKGCTLYTTLEPCPMCTATLCVCRMKRVVYVTADSKYGGSWDARPLPSGGITCNSSPATKRNPTCHCSGLHEAYYSTYDLRYEQFSLNKVAGALGKAQVLLHSIGKRVAKLELQGVPGTQLFDFLVPELIEAYTHFNNLQSSHLTTTNKELRQNTRTLEDLKKVCNIPY